jgi:mannose-6-phosphate isomerase-like protein (cupin superfamily)
MPVVTAQDAPSFDAPGATIIGLASPSRGSSDAAAWRVRLQADHASPPHSLTREEIFVVLHGSLSARYGDREETAEAGGALIVRPGERFELIAHGAPAEAVCVMAVGGQAVTDEGTFTPPWAR